MESRAREEAAEVHFITWFDTSANLDFVVKQKALLASRDVASTIITAVSQGQEELMVVLDLCQPQATHGHPNTCAEYRAKTADIRLVEEHEGFDQAGGNEVGQWQSQLDKLQPGKDFRTLVPKCPKEQPQFPAWDVRLKDHNQRRVELSKEMGTSRH